MFFKNRASDLLTAAAQWVMNGFLFLFPLFFLPFTLDPIEINKQTLLLISVSVISILLIASAFVRKEWRLPLSVSLLIPIGLVGAFIMSSVYSISPYLSWVGMSGSEYTSTLSFIGFALLFYVSVGIGKRVFTPRAWVWLLLGAAIAGLIGLLSVFGVRVFPFFPMLQMTGFNPIGTMAALGLFLVGLSVFGMGMVLSKSGSWFQNIWKDRLATGLLATVLFETLLILLVLDYALLWATMTVGCAVLFAFLLFRARIFSRTALAMLPAFFAVISLAFWFVLPSPFIARTPIEVGLNVGASKQIMINVLKRDPWFGTGPGTFSFDYALHHGIQINETDFWNTTFDRASSFFLTMAPTVGYVGIGLFLLLILAIALDSVEFLVRQKDDEQWKSVLSVFSAWVTLTFSAFFLSWNTVILITWFLFSGWLVSHVAMREKTIRFTEHKPAALVLAMAFVVCAFGLLIGIFLTTGRYAAEMAYARAIRADRTKADTQIIVAELDKAATINQYNDDYLRNLSQALLLRVQDELKTISPNAQLTDTSKKYVQSLVAAAVNAAVKATELSPRRSVNWTARAETYRSLTGLVDQSSAFAIDAYKHAIALEPLNPNTWTELGKTQLMVADSLQPLTLSKDTTTAEKAKKDWQAALDEAEKDFISATTLKSNFAPAHYQIALVYEREGKWDEAIGKLESVQKYNNTDVGVGFELGTLYLKRNGEHDLVRAQAVFEHVVQLAPSYSDAHWLLASVYEKLGKKDLAIKEIETVLKLNPDNQNIKTRLERLKNTP